MGARPKGLSVFLIAMIVSSVFDVRPALSLSSYIVLCVPRNVQPLLQKTFVKVLFLLLSGHSCYIGCGALLKLLLRFGTKSIDLVLRYDIGGRRLAFAVVDAYAD